MAGFSNGDDPHRDAKGHYLIGNPGGPGNPHPKHAAEWRDAARCAVTPADLRDVMAQLVLAARAGLPWAIHELLERCLGKHPLFDADEGRCELMAVAVQVQIDLGAVLARALAAVVHEPLVPGLPSPFDLAKE